MAGLSGVDEGVLCEVLGSVGAGVVRVMDRPMEDKAISVRLDCETSEVRAVLNELLVKNLVQVNRTRFETGYTNYRWVRRDDKIREYVGSYVDGRIRELECLLSDDGIEFECGCGRVDYGTAIERMFRCPGCGEAYREAGVVDGRKVRGELRRLRALRDAS